MHRFCEVFYLIPFLPHFLRVGIACKRDFGYFFLAAVLLVEYIGIELHILLAFTAGM